MIFLVESLIIYLIRAEDFTNFDLNFRDKDFEHLLYESQEDLFENIG